MSWIGKKKGRLLAEPPQSSLLSELDRDTAVELATRHPVERGQEAVEGGRQRGGRLLIEEVPDTDAEVGVPVIEVISGQHVVIDGLAQVVLGVLEALAVRAQRTRVGALVATVHCRRFGGL